MGAFETLQVLRALLTLREASLAQVAAFSGVSAAAVEAYLATRGDIAAPPADGRVSMLPTAREALFAEIAASYDADPSLIDRTDPGWDARVRDGIVDLEGLLAETQASSDGGRDLDYLALRLRAVTKAVARMRRHGRDVAEEERRLAGCAGRISALSA